MEKNTLVTITRQYGSGGREVADLVAKKMGVRRYDRKVVAMAAEKLGDEANFHDLIERSYNAPDNCLGNLGDYAYERVPQHNRMYIEQAKVILGVAEKESAVFLGRCADYILRKQSPLRLFIYADMESKIKRCMERQTKEEDFTEREMKRRIEGIDRERARYYNYFSSQKWGARNNYDLMISTSRKDIKQVSVALAQYLKALLF